MSLLVRLGVCLASLAAMSSSAFAAQPVEKGLNFQPAATPIMTQIHSFHTLLLYIIIPISLFVLGLLTWVVVRYNRKANPEPSRTTHNVAIEVVWTLIPIMILLVIAAPSFAIIDKEDNIPEADLTVKAIGHQWYWEYEYPDYEGIVFDSYMLSDEQAAKEGKPRLLATDTHVVVPEDTIVKVLITSVDVNHAWAIPAFGVKRDAIPGRINQTWFKVDEPGIYYGQCSELCGIKHGFMPITVEVVSKDEFETWIEDAKAEYADNSSYMKVGVGR